MKFRKIRQIGSKYFTLVGAPFSGKSIGPVFCSDERHKFENKKNKQTKLPLQTLRFSCLKFVSRWMRCAVKILDDFPEGSLRKSQIKP